MFIPVGGYWVNIFVVIAKTCLSCVCALLCVRKEVLDVIECVENMTKMPNVRLPVCRYTY